jgi:hypothetical protein
MTSAEKEKYYARKALLTEIKNRFWNDVFYLSANYLMTEPKDGLEQDWKEAVAKAELFDEILREGF